MICAESNTAQDICNTRCLARSRISHWRGGRVARRTPELGNAHALARSAAAVACIIMDVRSRRNVAVQRRTGAVLRTVPMSASPPRKRRAIPLSLPHPCDIVRHNSGFVRGHGGVPSNTLRCGSAWPPRRQLRLLVLRVLLALLGSARTDCGSDILPPLV